MTKKTRHEKEMKRLLDKLEKGVVSQLKKRENFMILPRDEDIAVCIVDGAGRNTFLSVTKMMCIRFR